MKNALSIAALLSVAAVYGWMLNIQPLSAAPSDGAAGTPPIGRLVDITLVAWPLTTQTAGHIIGTLVSMQTEWIVVKDGIYEHWVPTEKVMSIKATR